LKKRRRLFWLGLMTAVLAAVVIAALLEPNRILRGWIGWEHFYRWRPTSYWREILRDAGEKRQVSRHLSAEFYGHDAYPVLLDCGRDSDPKVRWAAIRVLERYDLRLKIILDLLTESLRDPDANVRLAGLGVLASWGRMARTALPNMIPLLHDPEEQICFVTDLALWEIDPATAREATGWKQFTSDTWGFSADLPGPAQESTLSGAGLAPAVSHQFLAGEGGVSQFAVDVTDCPEWTIFPATDEERLDFARNSILAGVTGQKLVGKVVEEKPVETEGFQGRDFRIEVEGMGFIRSRIFWKGRRLYQVKVASKPEFLNALAADYFLESFHILKD
jgi:hypothetical protein